MLTRWFGPVRCLSRLLRAQTRGGSIRLGAWLSVVVAVGLLGCSPRADDDAGERLAELIAREWEYRLSEDPLLATWAGDHRWNDRLPALAYADLERRSEVHAELLAEIEAIDSELLSAADRINAQMLARELRHAVENFELGGYQLPLNADSGFHSAFARLAREVPLRTVSDYENYVSRMRQAPVYFEQQISHLRSGLESGFSQPHKTLEGYEATMSIHLVEDATDSVFWPPFEEFPQSVEESEWSRLREAGRSAILEAVVPAYSGLHDFMTEVYIPQTRTSFGASKMPGGRDFYASEVRWFTTLDVTPEEVHQIGLEEVARIRVEMEAIVEEVGFEGSFGDFLEFLRTDARFYVDSPEALLKEASYIVKRMDGKLPSLFGRLPRLPYTVEPVPDHIAPKYTSARYVQAAENSGEPGIYWVNTHNLESRPLYSLEALSFHEAVPGHHLQIALAAELQDLPPFRRFASITAFVEGWALYAERLGIEVGFYTDPYSRFGLLSFEMWRACRLVVDTGVHALGWDRERMIDYMARNTALSAHEVETETDRYITWPGQALGYKMGELEIRKQRAFAEESLGSRFDVRDFHDAVLRNGAVPLGVLGELVREWVEAEGG